MNNKTNRELYEPSMTEVFLGAFLSLALGVVLAAVFLITKPVEEVRTIPEEPVAKMVYYIEGSRSASRAREANAKQKEFLQGKSVILNEDELNALVAQNATASKPKSDAAKNEKEEEEAAQIITVGEPTFRIADGRLEAGVPVDLQSEAYGFEYSLLVHARGGFAKRGEVFVFVPEQFYIGSCPIQRLPFVSEFLVKKVLAATPAPEELSAAWKRLSDVKIEDSSLHLTM